MGLGRSPVVVRLVGTGLRPPAGPPVGPGRRSSPNLAAVQTDDGVPATQAGDGVPATQAGDGVPATQAGDGVPATQAGDGVPATQAGAPGVSATEGLAAVARACPRLTALLRSVRNPGAPAIGEWTITDTAIHVSHAMDAVTAVAKGGGGILDDVWDLASMTAMFVKAESERDLPALADRIETSVAGFLEYMGTTHTGETNTWMVRGVQAPPSMVVCHILNELVIHGRDIATADGQSWPIDRTSATLILEGFVLPVLSGLGTAMVNADEVKAKHITFDVRLRGGGRHQFLFDDGQFRIQPGPPVRTVDCHLSVDPEAFLLVAWNRISQWSALPKGKLMAWGRKPWLGLQLRAFLKNP